MVYTFVGISHVSLGFSVVERAATPSPHKQKGEVKMLMPATMNREILEGKIQDLSEVILKQEMAVEQHTAHLNYLRGGLAMLQDLWGQLDEMDAIAVAQEKKEERRKKRQARKARAMKETK